MLVILLFTFLCMQLIAVDVQTVVIFVSTLYLISYILAVLIIEINQCGI